MTTQRPLTIAVPKGRILAKLGPLFRKAGLDDEALHADDRRLLREDKTGTIRYLFLKPDDVPTYVDYGAADLGICGRDVLLERRYDLYEPVDLNIGRCKLVVAAPIGAGPLPAVPRVATKFARVAAEYFLARGTQVEIISVGGSVELAPLVGLADLIVDLVETGTTLKENHLEVREVIREVSSVLVANRASYKLRHDVIQPLIEKLRAAVR
ncbi:MAG: ATP phosphoribosyltransferase [Polyangiaceae bacterium]